jgi:AraC-like DNA-binding protein
MQRLSLPPPRDLEPLVERFWGWRAEPGEIVRLPLVTPGVGAELVVHLGTPFRLINPDGSNTPCPAVHLMRPRSKPLDLAAQTDLHFLAVRIRAGASRHITPCPAADVPEGLPDAADIWGSGAVALRERLGCATSPAEQANVLSVWLRGLGRRLPNLDTAIDAAIERIYARPEDPIDSAKDLCALETRQFERRFKAATGLGPKRFQRLSRAYKLVRFESLAPSESYLPRALDLGFFDQAHAIHDLRELTGRTPTALLAELATRSHFYNRPRTASA